MTRILKNVIILEIGLSIYFLWSAQLQLSKYLDGFWSQSSIFALAKHAIKDTRKKSAIFFE